MNIYEIFEELNLSNGLNHKKAVLTKHKDNKLLSRILKMTYDTVIYRYYLTVNQWHKQYGLEPFLDIPDGNVSLETILDFMEEKLATRELTGHAGFFGLDELIRGSNKNARNLVMKIINRDLRINCGKTLINKIFPGLITKPVYMRCDVFTKKTMKNIKFPAIIQLKADGTYREMNVSNGKAEFISRSGESYTYVFEHIFSTLPEGHYAGELLVTGTQNRGESNGLLNSDNPPMDRIVFFVWDYITPEEYANAAKKIPNRTKYVDRFNTLREIIINFGNPQILPIESYVVNTIQEAFEKVVGWMNDDLEGGVLKDIDAVFEDGTSKKQLKMKLEMDLDVRIVGYREGTIGTKRENTFGALLFETDDKMIKGATSGMTDEQLEQINNNRDYYLGKIIAVSCNDLTKGRNNDHYALSHPRFKEVRTDKTETDDLQRAKQIKQMAMTFA